MKRVIPWSYQGTFSLTLVSEEDARFVPDDCTLQRGRSVLILEGKIRYSDIGYEFRTYSGLPFYFAPQLIDRIRGRWRDINWRREARGSHRICHRCGGSSRLLRPTKKKLLTYIRCSDCCGGLRGGNHVGSISMEETWKSYGKRLKNCDAA